MSNSERYWRQNPKAGALMERLVAGFLIGSVFTAIVAGAAATGYYFLSEQVMLHDIVVFLAGCWIGAAVVGAVATVDR